MWVQAAVQCGCLSVFQPPGEQVPPPLPMPIWAPVPVSVTSWCSMETDKRIKLIFGSSWFLSTYPIVFTESGYLHSKIRLLSSGTLSQTLNVADCSSFPPANIKLTSTEVCRQLITLSVHLCLRHDGRDEARCAGSSATADNCFKKTNNYIRNNSLTVITAHIRGKGNAVGCVCPSVCP